MKKILHWLLLGLCLWVGLGALAQASVSAVGAVPCSQEIHVHGGEPRSQPSAAQAHDEASCASHCGHGHNLGAVAIAREQVVSSNPRPAPVTSPVWASGPPASRIDRPNWFASTPAVVNLAFLAT